MKITNQQLKKIIKEEMQNALKKRTLGDAEADRMWNMLKNWHGHLGSRPRSVLDVPNALVELMNKILTEVPGIARSNKKDESCFMKGIKGLNIAKAHAAAYRLLSKAEKADGQFGAWGDERDLRLKKGAVEWLTKNIDAYEKVLKAGLKSYGRGWDEHPEWGEIYTIQRRCPRAGEEVEDDDL
jgi:hypothetical protein